MNFFASLDTDLCSPAHSLPIEGLMDLWCHDDVIVQCRRPHDFEECPDINYRMRSALGRQLRIVGDLSQSRRDPFNRPSAWEVLWRYEPPKINDIEVGRPLTVQCALSSQVIEVRVRLFGHARWWGPQVLAGLCEAMGRGVRLRSGGVHVSLEIISTRIERMDGVEANSYVPQAAIVRFLSGTLVRKGQKTIIDPSAIVMGAVRRVAATAPWMDVLLEPDMPDLEAACQRLDYDMSEALPWHSTLYSVRRGNTPLNVHAVGGSLRIEGPLAPLVPYLTLAQSCGLGASTAMGFGQVECIFF